jgi:hypothetical protein
VQRGVIIYLLATADQDLCSIGGIIALGLFARGWSVKTSIGKFESLCKRAFARRWFADALAWFRLFYYRYQTAPLKTRFEKNLETSACSETLVSPLMELRLTQESPSPQPLLQPGPMFWPTITGYSKASDLFRTQTVGSHAYKLQAHIRDSFSAQAFLTMNSSYGKCMSLTFWPSNGTALTVK